MSIMPVDSWLLKIFAWHAILTPIFNKPRKEVALWKRNVRIAIMKSVLAIWPRKLKQLKKPKNKPAHARLSAAGYLG